MPRYKWQWTKNHLCDFFMTILMFYFNRHFSHVEIISLWLCSRPSNCPRPPSSQYFEVSYLWIPTRRFLALLSTYKKNQHLRPNSVSKIKHIYWRRKMFQTHIGKRILVTWKCPAIIPKEKNMILDKPYGYIFPTFYITERSLPQGLCHWGFNWWCHSAVECLSSMWKLLPSMYSTSSH